jgi:hypothetical protein
LHASLSARHERCHPSAYRSRRSVRVNGGAAAQQPPFGIALEQAYLDLHHALSIEIQVMRVDGGAEQIWNRSFTLVQRYLRAALLRRSVKQKQRTLSLTNAHPMKSQ